MVAMIAATRSVRLGGMAFCRRPTTVWRQTGASYALERHVWRQTGEIGLEVPFAGASVGVAVGAIGADRVGPRDLVDVGAGRRRPAQVGVGQVGAEQVRVGEVGL